MTFRCLVERLAVGLNKSIKSSFYLAGWLKSVSATLSVVLHNEVAQLFDDGVYEFLFVPVCPPELGKDVVLLVHLLHPGDGKKERIVEGNTQKN